MSEVELGTVYELNKQIMASLAPMDVVAKNRAIIQLEQWFQQSSKYSMLLCNERKDYTIFAIREHSPRAAKIAANDIRECIDNRGDLVSVDYNSDFNSYEIWIRIDEEDFMFALFDYKNGVIEV